MISQKVAMLGMWGVGKTSLVQRYVHSIYDDKYHSSLGVKVDKKLVSLGDRQMQLMLWDIAGAEDYFSVPLHYVRGASGYMLVIDGTRLASLDCGIDLIKTVQEGIGSLPFVVMINKSDLEWEITAADIATNLASLGCDIFHCSAKTGENVEEAFTALAKTLLHS